MTLFTKITGEVDDANVELDALVRPSTRPEKRRATTRSVVSTPLVKRASFLVLTPRSPDSISQASASASSDSALARQARVDAVIAKLTAAKPSVDKMHKSAMETDPDKKVYGAAMATKIAALHASFATTWKKSETVKASIDPAAAEETIALEKAAKAKAEAEEAERKRKEAEAAAAEAARVAAEAAAAEAKRKEEEEKQRAIEEEKKKVEQAKLQKIADEKAAKEAEEASKAAAAKAKEEEAAAAKKKRQEEAAEKKAALVARVAAATTSPSPSTPAAAAAPSPQPSPSSWGNVRHIAGGATELRATLEEASAADALCVVDWSMTTCGPCQRVKPMYEQMARSRANALFVGIDVQASSANADLAREAAVTAFPTFHLYKKMQRVAEMRGADVPRLAQLIATHGGPIAPAAASSGSDDEPLPTTEEMQRDIGKALATLRGSVAEMSEFITSVKTLLTFVGNVVNHPGDSKYARVRTTNATFQSRLGRHPGGVAAMEAFGFKRVDEGGPDDALVISPRAAAHPALPQMRALLESAIPADQRDPAPAPTPPSLGGMGAMGGFGGLGGMGAGAGAGAGGMPSQQEIMEQLASNPAALNSFSSMLRANPNMIQQAAAANPAMAAALAANPQLAQQVASIASNPEQLAALLNDPTARATMMAGGMGGPGDAGGFGGMGGMPPMPPNPPDFDFAPRGMTEDEMLAEALRRSMEEETVGGGGGPPGDAADPPDPPPP